MALVSLKEILSGSFWGQYAVGGFNINSFEDAKGVVRAAEEERAPVILMTSVGAARYIGIRECVFMVRAMAAQARVPVCLHLDHAEDLDAIRQCVDAGFTSVMIDASKRPYEENIRITRSVVEYASVVGCSVEAELGRIGGHEETTVVEDGEADMTNPLDVPRFVEETGVDALAVSIGTAHGFYKSEPKLDFARVEKIRGLTSAALVLHGGTGVAEADFRRAIALGMNKINVGTQIKAAYMDEVRNAVQVEKEPRKLMNHVVEAVCEIVRQKIRIFGCAGKA